MGAAVVAIVSTYDVFTQTYDEPGHIAAGMEWLQLGRFTFEEQHPPLARAIVATGPYLAGRRLSGSGTMWQEGNAILYGDGAYARNLALARAGTLVFFLLGCGVVWWWARSLAGDEGALVGLTLFASASPVLAHAGLATTDMAAGATIAAALLAFDRWMRSPTLARSVALGVATAAAVLCKLSALLFLPLGAAVLVLAYSRESGTRQAASAGSHPRSLGIAAWVAALAIWAGYRFSVRWLGGVPLPAPELVAGVYQVMHHNAIGHANFLLGERRLDGWWYYFPLLLAVKTPLPLLLSGVVGGAAAWLPRDGGGWRRAAPALVAVIMLLAVIPSRINAGVRYLLPALPFLAISAAVAAGMLWRIGTSRRIGRAAVILLVAWQVLAAMRAHPDHLSWFNALAGAHPERIVVDSDLDWGQDLDRLAHELDRRGLRKVRLAYYGSADPMQHIAGDVVPLAPGEVATGWVAVSRRYLAGIVDGRIDDGYFWLRKYKPVKEIGSSILLYDVSPGGP